jgi:hypothetical protein
LQALSRTPCDCYLGHWWKIRTAVGLEEESFPTVGATFGALFGW